MCSLINKQLLLTAYAYLFIMGQQEAQQGSEALQLQVEQRGARVVQQPKTTEEHEQRTQQIMEIFANIGKDWREELKNLKNSHPEQVLRATVDAICKKFPGPANEKDRELLLTEARKLFDSDGFAKLLGFSCTHDYCSTQGDGRHYCPTCKQEWYQVKAKDEYIARLPKIVGVTTCSCSLRRWNLPLRMSLNCDSCKKEDLQVSLGCRKCNQDVCLPCLKKGFREWVNARSIADVEKASTIWPENFPLGDTSGDWQGRLIERFSKLIAEVPRIAAQAKKDRAN